MTSKLPPEISLYEIMLNKLPYTVEDVDGRPAFPSLAPPLREFTALLMRTLAELRIEYPPIPAQATSQPSSVTIITDRASTKFAQDVAREVSLATAGLSQAAMFPAKQDDAYRLEQLESAAAAYALAAADHKDRAEEVWPWDLRTFKPRDQRRNLVKAGALILAAIERIDRRDAEV